MTRLGFIQNVIAALVASWAGCRPGNDTASEPETAAQMQRRLRDGPPLVLPVASIRSEAGSEVIVGREFRIEGSFRTADPNAEPRFISVAIVGKTGKGEDFFAGTAGATGKRDSEGNVKFTARIKAPSEPGTYKLRARYKGIDTQAEVDLAVRPKHN